MPLLYRWVFLTITCSSCPKRLLATYTLLTPSFFLDWKWWQPKKLDEADARYGQYGKSESINQINYQSISLFFYGRWSLYGNCVLVIFRALKSLNVNARRVNSNTLSYYSRCVIANRPFQLFQNGQLKSIVCKSKNDSIPTQELR